MGFLPSCYTEQRDPNEKAKPVRPGQPIEVGSYLSDGWNRLDFFVVVTSFLGERERIIYFLVYCMTEFLTNLMIYVQHLLFCYSNDA